MVRKCIVAFLCASAAFVCSCSKEENLSTPPLSLEHSITLSAGVAGSDETRAIFNENGLFVWLKNDAIGVATTGSESLSELKLSSGSFEPSGQFTGTIKGSLGKYAVYPYNEKHKIKGDTLTYHLPDTYTYNNLDRDYYTGGTFYNNSACAPAYGVIDGEEVDGKAYTIFKHLGGVLCIRVTELKAGSGYITLTADRKITGDFTVDLNENEPEISTSSEADTTSTERTVTINYSCSDTYDATNGFAGVFYIPMPVGTCNLTMEVCCKDGSNTMVKVTKEFSHEETVNRRGMNKRKLSYATMAKGNYIIYNGRKFVDLGLPSGTFWAETNVGASVKTAYDYGGYYLWTDAVSKAGEWDWGCQLPTKEQAKELIDSCTLSEDKNHYGAHLTYKAGGNTNSIFLPAAGSYKRNSDGTYSEVTGDKNCFGCFWTSEAENTENAWEFKVPDPATSHSAKSEITSVPRTNKASIRQVLVVN